jgi:hypothetical protein
VTEFLIHPKYTENKYFDIAVLVLDKSVEELDGLEPYYEFSMQQRGYIDGQHLLTYVGYGVKQFCYDFFCFSDDNRRAVQSHTQLCAVSEEAIIIYSSPFGNSNNYKELRPLIPYEAIARPGMSGGACIHDEYGLVSIIVGRSPMPKNPTIRTYICVTLWWLFASVIDIVYTPINIFYNRAFVNKTATTNSIRNASVPLGPVKEWLEDIRLQHSQKKPLDLC